MMSFHNRIFRYFEWKLLRTVCGWGWGAYSFATEYAVLSQSALLPIQWIIGLRSSGRSVARQLCLWRHVWCVDGVAWGAYSFATEYAVLSQSALLPIQWIMRLRSWQICRTATGAVWRHDKTRTRGAGQNSTDYMDRPNTPHI